MDMSILEDIGLSQAEIDVYLALLELGQSTTGPIIEVSELQSSVVHRMVKQLVAKGLLSFVKIGKDRYYQATDPENLVNFIDEKRKRLVAILPELESKKLGRERNETEMFVGKKAMFSMMNNLIKDARKEEYLSFSLIEAHNDEDIIRFYKNYNVRRREKKLDVKVLVNRKVKRIYENNYSKELLRKANVRYTNFNFPQGIVIFRHQVIFLNWQEKPTAVKITNKAMAKQFKTFFLEFYNKEVCAY